MKSQNPPFRQNSEELKDSSAPKHVVTICMNFAVTNKEGQHRSLHCQPLRRKPANANRVKIKLDDAMAWQVI
jgi:hypothetical protein